MYQEDRVIRFVKEYSKDHDRFSVTELRNYIANREPSEPIPNPKTITEVIRKSCADITDFPPGGPIKSKLSVQPRSVRLDTAPASTGGFRFSQPVDKAITKTGNLEQARKDFDVWVGKYGALIDAKGSISGIYEAIRRRKENPE